MNAPKKRFDLRESLSGALPAAFTYGVGMILGRYLHPEGRWIPIYIAEVAAVWVVLDLVKYWPPLPLVAPRYRVHGWSWVGAVNFLLVQWFFVRIEASVETPVVPGESTMMLSLLRGVIPLTGWWTDYRFVVPESWRRP